MYCEGKLKVKQKLSSDPKVVDRTSSLLRQGHKLRTQCQTGAINLEHNAIAYFS